MKIIYLLLLLTIISTPAFADRGELYAWHELNNTGGTTIISLVVFVILGLILATAFLKGWLYDIFKGEYTKESNQMGCAGFGIILFLILAIMIRFLFPY